MELRRGFLRLLGAGLAGSTLGGGSLALQEKRRAMPEPPAPAAPGETTPDPPDPQSPQRALLKLNEKQFRESLTSLYERVRDLRQDLESMHTADIFSVKVYKQTDEIEHLAKRLKSLARF